MADFLIVKWMNSKYLRYLVILDIVRRSIQQWWGVDKFVLGAVVVGTGVAYIALSAVVPNPGDAFATVAIGEGANMIRMSLIPFAP